MRKRRAKKTDKMETEKAYQLLLELAKNHPEIEVSLWAGALMSAFVNMHMETGLSYEQFCGVLDDVKEHYRDWWERDISNKD